MKVALIAGEPSGDRLGAAAMAGLRALRPEASFVGIGGPAMAAEGLVSLFPLEDLSVMGLAEVVPRLPLLLRRGREATAMVLRESPDVLVTVDAPDFSLRVARRAKAARPSLPVVHYVAPSVWAWRPGRARRLRGVADLVLALLPFEPPLLEAAGVPCVFVGHPVAAEPLATEAEAAAFRASLGGEGPVVLALPGSRRGEVGRLAGRFGAALGIVAARHPGLRVVLPMAAPVAGMVREAVASWPLAPRLLDPAEDRDGALKRAAFRAADAGLAASGTVSLELAASGTPMVIGYDMSPLTWAIARRVVRLDTVTLVNLVSGTRAVPELLGPACTAPALAEALLRTLAAPGAQQEAMRLTMERLGRGGEPPGLRAARAILQAAERIQPPPRTREPSGA